MKNTKYRAEPFSPFDLHSVEEHLSAMAVQGWRLEYPDSRTTGEWLVQWPGRIAALRAEGLDLTLEQMTLIAARLDPENGKEEPA